MSEPKVLVYDIETTPLQTWVWRLGEQVVRPNQLVPPYNVYKIITISYMWATDKKAKSLIWDQKTKSCDQLIKDFDEIVKQADIIIGKNSDRFDNKHMQAQRWLTGAEPFPDWADCRDDVEQQLRRNFALPSYALDYVSQHLGLGGKIKMEFQDWVDIMVGDEASAEVALKKMAKYNRKDVEDTLAIYNSIKPYIKPKHNMATFNGTPHACTKCGSTNVIKNGTKVVRNTKYQVFRCNAHHGHAGRKPFDSSDKTKMGI